MRDFKMGLLVAAAIGGVAASPSLAVDLDFESGDLTGWTTNGGPASAVTAYHGYSPISGTYLGVIEAGLGAATYTTLSQTFTLAAGETLSGFVGFQANDYIPYNDDAYLSVNGINIFTSNVATVGDYGSSGWTPFSYTAATGGSYTLELGVRNVLDNGLGSGAVLDAGAIPETASWMMIIGGFGMVGAGLRARKVSFAR